MLFGLRIDVVAALRRIAPVHRDSPILVLPQHGGQAMHTIATSSHQPWNKGKLVGQKARNRPGIPSGLTPPR
ncbi:hypothetical protein D3879_24860 [Pseudomonas cavernicola]|uniref:Uncharacterized protein n=1 Tax=Pseudomonas cavernicola TaxID=2320866 RepID=A0A418X990_9PSED|nr:hypothetical protein D3879_24860 [Pseudomonas cavernicola]